MFQPVRISPSILAADFMNLGRDIQLVEDAGAGFIHVDVMDGHFVPNLTVGVPVLKQLSKASDLPTDVHLMIDNPLMQLPWYLEAGASSVTIHVEALSTFMIEEAINTIHDAGAKAALSLKPATPASVVEPYLPLLDMVLVMSVEPGFSGQRYIDGIENKVAEIAAMAAAVKAAPLIEVDGGIDKNTTARVVAAGADVLVCGNAVFKAHDPKAAVKTISAIAEAARHEAMASPTYLKLAAEMSAEKEKPDAEAEKPAASKPCGTRSSGKGKAFSKAPSTSSGKTAAASTRKAATKTAIKKPSSSTGKSSTKSATEK